MSAGVTVSEYASTTLPLDVACSGPGPSPSQLASVEPGGCTSTTYLSSVSSSSASATVSRVCRLSSRTTRWARASRVSGTTARARSTTAMPMEYLRVRGSWATSPCSSSVCRIRQAVARLRWVVLASSAAVASPPSAAAMARSSAAARSTDCTRW